jgi:hypothetical protein
MAPLRLLIKLLPFDETSMKAAFTQLRLRRRRTGTGTRGEHEAHVERLVDVVALCQSSGYLTARPRPAGN